MWKFYPKKTRLWLAVYSLVFGIYALFSYAFTAPNLTLSSFELYQSFQVWMWHNLYNNRLLASWIFLLLISALIVVFLLVVRSLHRYQKELLVPSPKKFFYSLLPMILPLFLSYNSLSFDVFNYMFNAKMVVFYQANPHIKTGLDFASDPWVRFMHNIHTPAPYGYGWTTFSLLPYWLGRNKFLPTWLIFRALSIISLGLLVLTIYKLAKQLKQKLTLSSLCLLFLNPLLLLEIISNSHNDLWMLLPAMWSFILLTAAKKKKKKLVRIIGSLLLFLFSVSTKYASAVLAPVWLYLLIETAQDWKLAKKIKQISLSKPLFSWLQKNWPLVCSVLLFIPLFSSRSQQFHPWYLTWSLVWLPLISSSWWRALLTIFSFSSLYRYYPWIRANDYSPQIFRKQKLITWTVPTILAVVSLLNSLYIKVRELLAQHQT